MLGEELKNWPLLKTDGARMQRSRTWLQGETEDATCVLVADAVEWVDGAEGRELELSSADVLGAELNWWS